MRSAIHKIWTRSPQINLTRLVEKLGNRHAGSKKQVQRLWCLSTGRVGTATLASLAELASGYESHHEPKPSLFGMGKIAYSLSRREYSSDASELGNRCLMEALRACRSLEDRGDLNTIETSPQATFLAAQLTAVFPRARFVHVIRSPFDVIRSGMRRRWYSGHPNDAWRIEPHASDPLAQAWPALTAFEKNVWCWAETNRWIEEFTQSLPADRSIVLRSEELFSGSQDALKKFYGLLEVELPSQGRIESILGKVLNAQTKGNFAESDKWSTEQIDFARRHAADVMDRFEYTF